MASVKAETDTNTGDGVDIEAATPLSPFFPSRFFFVDAWDLNNGLLAHTVNLSHQSTVIVGKIDNENFFEPAFQIGYEDGLYTNITRDWVAETKRTILAALEKDINLAEEGSARAFSRGQNFIACVRPQWLINPATLSKSFTPQGYHGPAWQAAMVNTVPAMYSFRVDGSFAFAPLNESMLPDDYLCTWRMVFTIRHPIALFGAIYRELTKGKRLPAEVMKPVCELFMTFRWVRLLYDWAATYSTAQPPIIIQCETVTNNLRPMVRKICLELELDESVVLFEKLEEQITMQGPGLQQSQAVFNNLTAQGVDALQARIAVAVSGWEVEFGRPAAYMLADFVRAAIPDWEYLRDRAMTLR
ncbi:hypothetical protein ASPCAL13663 [Aspergillus calidoustus]|uniref:Uncharacterized protein n=1 Tax=Aspergillus calidoustus TaxID=454130 RepID=A0A0U5GDY5_ASPCI|nr:hypothetical protein ASPCAL13663 [Aspergillus calidoustus]